MTNQKRLRDLKGIRGALYRLEQLELRASFALSGFSNFVKLRSHANGSKPAIAAVVVGRNDDYMSDFKERLYATVAWNIEHLVDEVVFVEWNPPADRQLLSLELAQRFEKVRAYVVPSKIHHELCENAHVKLLEYHAKNVGIRRARSPWIMSTNADAAVAFDAIRTIANAQLEPDVVWTAERVDIPWHEGRQDEISIWNSLRYRRVIPYSELGTGEFCLTSREMWHKIRGFDELMVRHRIGCDVRGTAQMLAHGGRIKRVGTVLHLTHPTSCTESRQPHHGEQATPEGVPYHNSENWGLGNLRETELAERVWQLS